MPGGFGTGKTVLLQQIAKWCDADVIVYVGCGERGNELADVVAELGELRDPRSGGRLAERTVIIANTSNMPIMAREASIYTAVTVAEYYRDMGYDAVVIADSTSRWAEALREFASRTGALPAEEGYPAGLASALAAFYERAGRVTTLCGATGSVTVIGAISPPGGDMTEPVTAHTQRFVRSLWTLDRDLAYARHYPAVTWVGSYCRDAETVGAWHAAHGDGGWAGRRARPCSGGSAARWPSARRPGEPPAATAGRSHASWPAPGAGGSAPCRRGCRDRPARSSCPSACPARLPPWQYAGWHVGAHPVGAQQREVPGEHRAVLGFATAVAGRDQRDLVNRGLLGEREGDAGEQWTGTGCRRHACP